MSPFLSVAIASGLNYKLDYLVKKCVRNIAFMLLLLRMTFFGASRLQDNPVVINGWQSPSFEEISLMVVQTYYY